MKSIQEKIKNRLSQYNRFYKTSGISTRNVMAEIAISLRKEFFAELKEEIGLMAAMKYFREIANV